MTWTRGPFSGTPLVFSTWNPSAKDSDIALSGGDLIATSTNIGSVIGTGGVDAATANAYFEVTIGGTDTNQLVGLANSSITLTGYVGQDANGYGVYRLNGNFFNSGSSIGGSALYIYAAGDVLGFWLDAGTLKVAKNSALLASFNTIATGLTGTWYPAYSTAGTGPPPSSSGTLNTGGSAFSYQPTGSNAWG